MKVVIRNSFYVQKKDILFLKLIGVLLPQTVFDEVMVNNFKNGNEFIKIDSIEGIEFFKNLDFIVDYDLYKDITLEDYEKMDLDISLLLEQIESSFNAMSELEAMENLYLVEEVEKLEYKREELMNILRFRHGCIDAILSDDINYFDRYKKVRRFRK